MGHAEIFLNCSGGVIIDDNGRVLLGKRADRNTWGFPGGTMELGETLIDAAKREIWEETGLEVEVENQIRYADC